MILFCVSNCSNINTEDEPSPATMFEEVLFHPLNFFIPMPGQSEVIFILMEFSFTGYTCPAVPKIIFLEFLNSFLWL